MIIHSIDLLLRLLLLLVIEVIGSAKYIALSLFLLNHAGVLLIIAVWVIHGLSIWSYILLRTARVSSHVISILIGSKPIEE